MSNRSKQKGKRGEQEFNAVLNSILGKIVKKRAAAGLPAWEHGPKAFVDVQANDADIQSLDGLAIEVKRQEVLNVKGWWRQAERQADNQGGIPILAYRQNRKPWIVCLPAYLLVPRLQGFVTIDIDVFEEWLYHYLS